MGHYCNRRNFLTIFGSALLSLKKIHAFEPKILERLERQEAVFASAYMDQNNHYGIALIDKDGAMVANYSLPSRGHGMAVDNASGWLVAFSRRPGNFALATQLKKRQEPVLFRTPPNTHFYGHGVFSQNGKLLFATENRFEDGIGGIGVYDATNKFSRVGEFSSFGIGPHEMVMMPNQTTLCVANGGIMTHPDFGRAKLNLDSMESSIVFIDSQHGELINKFDTSVNRLSLRHMAIGQKNTVWIGGQYQGADLDDVPLIACASASDGLSFPNCGEPSILGLSNYIGSVACSDDGKRAAFSSPKGNTVLILDTTSKKIIHQNKINQVCGLSFDETTLIHSTYEGSFNDQNHKVFWDNHISPKLIV